MLQSFANWLKSPTGYNYTETQARQHAAQVRKVWTDTGEPGIRAFNIDIIEKWFSGHVETCVPGTMLSYLASVKKFVEFMETTDTFNDPKTKTLLKRAVKVVGRMAKQRDVERSITDLARGV